MHVLNTGLELLMLRPSGANSDCTMLLTVQQWEGNTVSGSKDVWMVFSIIHHCHCFPAGVVACLHDQEQTPGVAGLIIDYRVVILFHCQIDQSFSECTIIIIKSWLVSPL